MTKLFLQCDNCGKEFERTKSQVSYFKKHYCCRECASQGKTKFNTVALICHSCGEEYLKQKSIAENSKYCCRLCADNGWRIEPSYCEDCGKELSRGRGTYCKNCMYLGERHHNWKGGGTSFNCDYCEEECFQVSSNYNPEGKHHFCSKECEGNWRSENIRGDKCGSWKGGITKIYQAVRTLREYRVWRKFCFEREDYTCELCNTRGGYLEVHHIKLLSLILQENNIDSLDKAINCIELWDEDNGQVLCKDCHNITHKRGKL